MRNRRVGVVSVISLFLSFSASAESNWISIGESNDGLKWEAKPGSFEFSKNKNNVSIAVLAGRVVNSKTTDIRLYKWYVSASDCANKMGKLVSLNVGGEFEFDSDFMFGGGNVSSGIAEFICSVAGEYIKQVDGKSL